MRLILFAWLGVFVAALLLAAPVMAETGEAGPLHTLDLPCRLFDSRIAGSGQLQSSGLWLFGVRHGSWVFGGGGFYFPPPSEACTVPDDASHVSIVVTAIGAGTKGHLKPLWNGAYASLPVSMLNYGPSITAGDSSTSFVMPLCGETFGFCDGDFGLYNGGVGPTDVAIYLYGWYD